MDEIMQNPAINEFIQKYDKRDWNQVIIKLCLISLGYLNFNNPKPLYSFDELDEVLLNFQNENNHIPSSQNENKDLYQYQSNNNSSNVWICKNCGNKNFGFILNCNRCGQSKNTSNITFGQVNNQPSFINNNFNPLINSNSSNRNSNIYNNRRQIKNNFEMNSNENDQNNINLNNNNLNDNEMNNENLNDYNPYDNEMNNDNNNDIDNENNPLNNPEYDNNNNNKNYNFNNDNSQSLDCLSQSNDYTFPEYINYPCSVICCQKCFCNPCCCIYNSVYYLNNKNYNYESSSYNMSSHIINDNNFSGRKPCPDCH